MGHNVKLYTQMLKTVREMEQDMGLEKLSNPERLTLISIADAQSKNPDGAMLDAILTDTHIAKMPPATFYRSLKSLRAKGLVRHVGSQRSGHYSLNA